MICSLLFKNKTEIKHKDILFFHFGKLSVNLLTLAQLGLLASRFIFFEDAEVFKVSFESFKVLDGCQEPLLAKYMALSLEIVFDLLARSSDLGKSEELFEVEAGLEGIEFLSTCLLEFGCGVVFDVGEKSHQGQTVLEFDVAFFENGIKDFS